MSSEDRRAPGAMRAPFEGLVEVGGALGPSFEAQAVNVSEDGMQIRTAYLPEVGQPLSCRFDAGPGQSVMASGEVVWAQGAERGGEFGVRFTDLDAESVDALKRACGVEAAPPVQPGAKVRLHIDGLASPMRAKIKDSDPSAVTVGSELGFLRVGKQLELEDAQSGAKRPASIDRVEVAVDPESRIPQLVVTLRYADTDGRSPASPEAGRHMKDAASSAREDKAPPPLAPAVATDDLGTVEEASAKMKGVVAHNIARIGPAFERLLRRAKTTALLLAKRRGEREPDEATRARRTTALPPGGGLHAAGRRVVRGDSSLPVEPSPGAQKLQLTKRKAAIAGAVMIAAILGAMAIKRSHHDGSADQAAAASAQPQALTAEATPSSLPAALSAPSGAPAGPALQAPPSGIGPALGASPPAAPAAIADNGSDTSTHASHKRHAHPMPFGNGPVHHGNVLHLKMDAPIDAIEGAQQPTGFTVKLPGRKSLEAAGPLAARDARIAAIKVSNESAGAELSVVFKDGVPNYQVSGKGDTLVISIAPPGMLDMTVAKKDEKGGKSPKHAKHHKHDDDGASTGTADSKP